MDGRILLVDDDPRVRTGIGEFFAERGYDAQMASSAEEALDMVKNNTYALILLDVKLPGMSGVEALPHLRETDPQAEIIVITGHGNTATAMEALSKGAYDYFNKPFSLFEMEVVIKRAMEKQKLKTEIHRLKEKLNHNGNLKGIIGESESMQRVKKLIERVAPLDSTVLIMGESGTGKELIADTVHMYSKRAKNAFVKINCAAIPENLLESELFGYERGAFTGAAKQKPGKFEMSDGGTIFLDEIGDMPISLQAKMLRVVEQKQVERLGGKDPISFDSRIIAATNQALPELIEEKRFREDLYYRLNVATIHLPPLRERREDLPILSEYFLERINVKIGTDLAGISRDGMELMLNYEWPGNVRELANVLERAAIFSSGPTIKAEDLREAFQKKADFVVKHSEEEKITLKHTLQEIEKSLIMRALRKSGGVQTEAATVLGLTPKNLWKKIRKHGIDSKTII